MEAPVASSIVVRKRPSHTSNSESSFVSIVQEVQDVDERRGVRDIDGQNPLYKILQERKWRTLWNLE